jgi:hypothetical protein
MARAWASASTLPSPPPGAMGAPPLVAHRPQLLHQVHAGGGRHQAHQLAVLDVGDVAARLQAVGEHLDFLLAGLAVLAALRELGDLGGRVEVGLQQALGRQDVDRLHDPLVELALGPALLLGGLAQGLQRRIVGHVAEDLRGVLRGREGVGVGGLRHDRQGVVAGGAGRGLLARRGGRGFRAGGGFAPAGRRGVTGGRRLRARSRRLRRRGRRGFPIRRSQNPALELV